MEHKKVKPTHDTSWGGVASWYDAHLQGEDTYHRTVIFPRLQRMMGHVEGKHVLDLACGQGDWAILLSQHGARVQGTDISKELITLGEKRMSKEGHKNIELFVTKASDLFMIRDKQIDYATCILALQNIEDIQSTFKEVRRVLKPGAKFFFVLNHPSFRVPKQSAWGYDEKQNVQYRRIEEYLSESKIKIDMHPGSNNKKQYTISFHRPLQYWSKILAKTGFVISRIEEWESTKNSVGKRGLAENKARKEIPLFLCIEAV